MWLKKRGVIATALVCGMLVMAPTLAEAAAGGRSSMGSRGSRTYDSGAGRSIDRSTTAPMQRQAPAAQPQTPQTAPGMAGGMQRPGFGMGSPIMTGIMAGLAGSFIGNMLFGSQNAAQAAQNPEASPTGSFIGSLLPFLMIGGIGLLAFLFFRRRSQGAMSTQALARGPVDLSGLRGGAGGGLGGGFGAAHPATPDIDIGAADQETFGRLLLDIQSAWGRHDVEALKPLLTQEMSAYFAGQLAELKGRGLTNKVEDVTLLKGEGTEAWSEGGTDYATAVLRWSARDYTVDASGQVVEGDRTRPVETEEVWTFVRQPGDHWRLSAIQQV
jgi:predicted lipid-binding transport protein (Tim44 family)